ncbi:hypothetical protein [Corynebacterium stationis]|uniref:Uncharacterized protein n=1 Tax=Corynebacterium stationis TaxID=1705 RepID=A0AB36CNP5_9CORY|nr:hypothetical protein [Corynebacterium stationis]NME90505.1 hypothetical protein [Corynebacterium stationis]
MPVFVANLRACHTAGRVNNALYARFPPFSHGVYNFARRRGLRPSTATLGVDLGALSSCGGVSYPFHGGLSATERWETIHGGLFATGRWETIHGGLFATGRWEIIHGGLSATGRWETTHGGLCTIYSRL